MVDDPTETSSDLDALTIRSILSSLRQAGGELDRLCLTATVEGSNEASQLADASHCVHRALILLSELQR
jgi:hypothetical protein